jgi:glycerate 2-kinase
MRGALSDALSSALRAADPVLSLRSRLTFAGRTVSYEGRSADLSSATSVLVCGAGKASAALAAEVIRSLRLLAPPLPCTGGVVVTRDGHASAADESELLAAGVSLRFASHPVPDNRGQAAAAELLDLISGPRAEGACVFMLLSGGASALLPAPPEGVSLAELSATSAALLASGAPIADMNAVRKHVSCVAGGRLAATAAKAGAAALVNLVVSDVIGDRLDVIGSGPCVQDESTFDDALRVVRERALNLPDAVMNFMRMGAQGLRPESDKEPLRQNHHIWLLANNAAATSAASATLVASGYAVDIVTNSLDGEASEVAVKLAAALISLPERSALIYGGETVVTLGDAKVPGGRNQELSLAVAHAVAERGGGGTWAVACLATDGSDGTAPESTAVPAGALTTSSTIEFLRSKSIDAGCALQGHESYAVLDAIGPSSSSLQLQLPWPHGGHLYTGPTGTNVMDVTILIRQ